MPNDADYVCWSGKTGSGWWQVRMKWMTQRWLPRTLAAPPTA